MISRTILAISCALLVALLMAQAGDPDQPNDAEAGPTKLAPHVDLDGYTVIALDDSLIICRPTGPGKGDCTYIPSGSILLVPHKVTPAPGVAY